mmetsp:Transcript_101810/g.296850  ORF Transcript_101810/g.296850 Transcript_101810/m.296850 type:complete len:82 (+) Transcript_101810:84-329(+)
MPGSGSRKQASTRAEPPQSRAAQAVLLLGLVLAALLKWATDSESCVSQDLQSSVELFQVTVIFCIAGVAGKVAKSVSSPHQ